jgi:hypothetical protein
MKMAARRVSTSRDCPLSGPTTNPASTSLLQSITPHTCLPLHSLVNAFAHRLDACVAHTFSISGGTACWRVAQLFLAMAKCFPYEKSHDRDHSQLYQTYMHVRACMLTTGLATFTQHRRALPHSGTHVHCGLAFMGSSIVASVGCPDQLASLTLWGGQAAVCMLELSAMLSLAKPSLTLSTHTCRTFACWAPISNEDAPSSHRGCLSFTVGSCPVCRSQWKPMV